MTSPKRAGPGPAHRTSSTAARVENGSTVPRDGRSSPSSRKGRTGRRRLFGRFPAGFRINGLHGDQDESQVPDLRQGRGIVVRRVQGEPCHPVTLRAALPPPPGQQRCPAEPGRGRQERESRLAPRGPTARRAGDVPPVRVVAWGHSTWWQSGDAPWSGNLSGRCRGGGVRQLTPLDPCVHRSYGVFADHHVSVASVSSEEG